MAGIGIIGCGKISQVRHIPEYEANPDARVVALYDVNLDRARELAGAHGARAYATMGELLADPEDSIEFSVRIGKEDSGVDKCAIITAAYKVGDEVVGRAGVIGPERMDYKKVIGVLDYIKKALGTVLDDDKDNE